MVKRHQSHVAAKFGVLLMQYHDKLPTLYWLLKFPKIFKRPHESCLITNFGLFSNTFSFLSHCDKNIVIEYCENCTRGMLKI